MSNYSPPGTGNLTDGTTYMTYSSSGVQVLGLCVVSISAMCIGVAVVKQVMQQRYRTQRRGRLLAMAAERAQEHRTLHPHAEPLPAALKGALPAAVFRTNDAQIEDRTCAICLTDYEDREEILTLPCKHTFHKDCIGLWFGAHSTCPICRMSLLPHQPQGEGASDMTPSHSPHQPAEERASSALEGSIAVTIPAEPPQSSESSGSIRSPPAGTGQQHHAPECDRASVDTVLGTDSVTASGADAIRASASAHSGI